MVVQYLVEVTLDLLFLYFAITVTLSNVLKESNLNVFDLLLDVMLCHWLCLCKIGLHTLHIVFCHHVVQSSAPT